MKSISARDVLDIRLLDRSKAEQLLGGAHGAGTILVRLRRSGSRAILIGAARNNGGYGDGLRRVASR
jgi:hypothetical protein